jgi:hypothetical protein
MFQDTWVLNATLSSVDLVRVAFYAHESARAFAETSSQSHGFLGASKKKNPTSYTFSATFRGGRSSGDLPARTLCLYRTNAEAISVLF